MDNISRIQKGLVNGEYSNSPVQSSEDRAVLAGEYAWIMGQLEEILSRKPSVWNKMRPDYKSDTACERAWEATEDGINEACLRLRAKGVEKMMQALGSLIRIAEGESKNLY